VGPYISTEVLSAATEGYSGADVHLVCREAAMMPMRRLLGEFSPQQINSMKQEGTLDIPVVGVVHHIRCLIKLFGYLLSFPSSNIILHIHVVSIFRYR
jgi:SpoVK/Ycf46/Vps4 family AAA+-type ATPase